MMMKSMVKKAAKMKSKPNYLMTVMIQFEKKKEELVYQHVAEHLVSEKELLVQQKEVV